MRLAAGVLVSLVGAVWILQGLEVRFAPQSFMTGSRLWAVLGGLMLLAGGTLIRWHRAGGAGD